MQYLGICIKDTKMVKYAVKYLSITYGKIWMVELGPCYVNSVLLSVLVHGLTAHGHIVRAPNTCTSGQPVIIEHTNSPFIKWPKQLLDTHH